MISSTTICESNDQRQGSLEGETIVDIARRVAIEERALDVRCLDVSGLTDVADYLVIGCGPSNRHSAKVAEKIKVKLKEYGEDPVRVSNKESSDWIVIDYGDVVVHVFYEATRQFYQLDELWSKAALIPTPDDLKEVVKGLRTGMYTPST